jgi:hypothetical protein
MAEGRQYIPKQYKGREFGAGSITQAKVATKFYKTASADPAKTDDTGEGYIVGSVWTNTSSGQVFICTSNSAENSTWIGQEGDNINLFLFQAATAVGRAGGFQDGSGVTPLYQTSQIQRMAIASEGDSTDIGELSTPTGTKAFQGGVAKDGYPASYAYKATGVNSHPGNEPVGEMIRFATSSPSSSGDIGEMSNKHAFGGSACNSSNWFVYGGGNAATSPSAPYSNQIEKVTFAASASASDSGGDLSPTNLARFLAYTDASNDRGYFSGGYVNNPPGPETNTIAYFPLGISSGNETDHAESTNTHSQTGCNNSSTHGYIIGNFPTVTDIHKFTFASPNTNTDVGDLIGASYEQAGSSAPDTGYAMGGGTYPPSQSIDTIQKFSYTSDGNASDVGEITEMSHDYTAGWQD